MSHLLFTYGTLHLPHVQRTVFGRELPGEPDAVVGHRLTDVEITDPVVIAASGTAIHPMLEPSSDPADRVDGHVLALDDDQLAAADAYEVDAYRRVEVRLTSGRTAWVYALANTDGSAGDADYGTIGVDYASYRQPEPAILAAISEALGPAESVLNVGAGAGSYEPRDRDMTAVEPSATMRAQRPAHVVEAIDASAEDLPFPDGAFDAAMATFTVHQWADLKAGLREMRRVTSGPCVVLTCDPSLLDRFWLAEYAPEVIETEARRYPDPAVVADLLGGGEVRLVPIPLTCTDGFGEAYYGRPEALLDPGARRANSAWSFVDPAVHTRFERELGADLASGRWDERHGHLRTQPTFHGSLVLVVAAGRQGGDRIGDTLEML